jgi:hypothetical protein
MGFVVHYDEVGEFREIIEDNFAARGFFNIFTGKLCP